MKYLIGISIVLSLILSSVSGQTIDCYSCSSTFIYTPASVVSDTCYAPVQSANTTCNVSANAYCLTEIILSDGLISSIARRCADGATDFDPSTTGVPGNDCNSSLALSGTTIDTTTCYQACTSNFCNSATDTSFTPCTSACANGYCNYFTGSCVCPTGFTGTDCSTAATTTLTYRSCAQCNSEVDGSTCTDGTYTPSNCPSNDTTQGYCAYTTTNLLLDDVVVRTFVTRGCAEASSYTHRDECFYSDPADTVLDVKNYIEYTCTAVCDTNNCNMAPAADGLVVAPETAGLYCVVCSDPTGTGSCNTTTRTLCPSGSTHCSHTVSYYLSARTDLSYSAEAMPGYRLLSVERSCATAAVTASCTSSSITGSISTLEKYTCTETCQTDGCNTGWPNRPRCAQCTTETGTDIKDGYDTCLSNPPTETDCTFPYEGFCVTRDYHKSVALSKSKMGFTRNVQRGCSNLNIGSTCLTQFIVPGQPTQNCNYTCVTDGCNQGVYNGFSRVCSSFVYTVLPALVGILFQSLFYEK